MIAKRSQESLLKDEQEKEILVGSELASVQ
jgi:hypothetical protein